MSDPLPAEAARRPYHHGDLRRALLDAGMALARERGPEAVVLREATRRAGVVPNAAYRHFASRDALLAAVRAAALAALATAMGQEVAAIPQDLAPPDASRAHLRAIGTAYLRFALTETGLFRTAFAVPPPRSEVPDPAMADAAGLNPFQHLSAALDRLVAAGVLPEQRRVGAEYLAWSAVHGLAMLVISGPLHGMDRTLVDGLSQRLLAMVEAGL
jgi:AcrR family transcriptional regulator